MSNKRSTFLRGTLIIFVGTVIGSGSGFAIRSIIANSFSQTSYGLIILGVTTLNLLSIVSTIGLTQAIVQRIPTVEKPAYPIQTAFCIAIPTSIIFATILAINAVPISDLINEPLFPPILIIFSISIPLLVFVKILVATFRGLSDAIGRVIVQNIIYNGGTLFFVFLISFWEYDSTFLGMSWPLSLIFASVIGLTYSHWNLSDLSLYNINLEYSEILSQTKSLVPFALPLVAAQGAWMVIEQADNLYLAYFWDASHVAEYDAAFTIGRVFLMGTGVVGFLALPRFAEYQSENNMDEFNTFFKRATKWMIFLFLPLLYTVLLIPELILATVFEPEYKSAWPALIIISFGFFTHIASGVNTEALTSLERSKTILYANLVGLFANLLLNTMFVPKYGGTGAAIASAISFGLLNLFLIANLCRTNKFTPISRRTVVPSVISLLVFIIFFGIRQMDVSTYSKLAIIIITVLSHWFVIIVFGGIGRADMQILNDYDDTKYIKGVIMIIDRFVK